MLPSAATMRTLARMCVAALNAAAGTVSGRCFPQHRHQEFLRFLRQLDAEYEPVLDLHVVLDNYGTYARTKLRTYSAG